MHPDTAHFDSKMGTDDMAVEDFLHVATSTSLDGDSLSLSLSSGPKTEPESRCDRCIGVEPRPKEVCSSPSPLLLQPLQVSEGELEGGAVVDDGESLLLQGSLGGSRCWSGLAESPSVVPELVLLPQLSVSVEPMPISGNIHIHPEQNANFSQLDPIPEEMVYENDSVGERKATTNSTPLLLHQVTSDSSTTVYSAEDNAWMGSPAEPISTIESTPASTTLHSEFHQIPSYQPVPGLQSDLVPNEVDTDDPEYTSSAASTNGENSSVFDEDYHSDTSSHTASLLSDVKDYCYENGRRYHSYREGHYVLPNDEPEQDRQDLLHHVRNLVLNGSLFRAPISKNIQRVLDIGTGTGIWAIDFADSYPGTEVVGTDLSPIQPSWVPPNLRFIVDDAESPWLFSTSRPFDFIHVRDLGGAIADWPRLLRQAHEHLRPGGWVELQEFEVTLKSDDDEELHLAPTLREYLGQLHAASEAFHRPMNIAEGHRQRLIEAGFEDVRDEVYKETSTFPIWSVSAGVLIGLTVAFSILYELYWSPLSDFPGPKLWAITRLPLQISVIRGKHHLDVHQMFQKYGPVVRISPDELAFGTARSIHDIYGQRPGGCFEKDPSHYFTPPNGAHHIVSTPDHSVHARQRRLLAPAFTERALRDQECLIQGYVDTLICMLREKVDVEGETSSQQRLVDLRDWINYTTFDITGDLMFGESFDCLKDTRLHPWIDLLANSIKALSVVGIAAQFPSLKTILDALTPSKYTKQAEDHFNLTAEKVDRRLEANISRPDFISAILKNGLSEKKGQYCDGEKIMSRAEIHSNAFILIIAGSETSATCVTGCIYYLCMNPQTLARLVNEIRSSFENETEMTFRTIATLKYLSAVIEEGLRMYPPLVTSLCRLVPKGGALVDGHYVPEGTKVAFHHYASYWSSSNFALPDEFIPDRWLGSDARFNGDSKDVLQPFSYGPRACIGKSLAYAQIRLILCKLLWHFDIKLCPEIEQGNWTDQGVWFFWSKPPLMATLHDRFAEESLSSE